MKKILLVLASAALAIPAYCQFGSFLNKVADKTADKVSDKTSGIIANDILPESNSNQNSAQQNNSTKQNTNQNKTANNSSTNDSTPAISFKSYSNYDFVPGDTVIFEDNFADDQDGEFPSHWNLEVGQAILNKVGTDEAFCLTDGNYAVVSPRMKNNSNSYLTHTFTVEFNWFVGNDGYGPVLRFITTTGSTCDIGIDLGGNISTSGFSKDLNAYFTGDNSVGAFRNKWHHVAIILKDGQLKCYIDQYRELVMPNLVDTPASLKVCGIGAHDYPIIFKDFRLASGGKMNTIGKKFTDAKIVTHGINFDVDKATIKPESMGTLNMIVKIMNNNPDLKFEVDGHTDNTGDAQHNLTLSQQRADAVKAQLVSMGIDASRLTTKGFGDTKPISTNDTQEGRANNRRVEFVRM